MDESTFWQIVDEARADSDGDGVAERALEHLVRLGVDAVRGFGGMVDRLMDRAYTWELWGAAYVGSGGCTEDGFENFRGWLITQGRDAFEAALRDPESLALLPEPYGECEQMLQVASQAAMELGGDAPERYAPPPSEPRGNRWNEVDVETLYPRLVERLRIG